MMYRNLLLTMNSKLSNIESNFEKIINTKSWIGINEAGKYAGLLSVSTLHRAIASGTLKSSRRCGKILLRYESIDAWLDSE